MRRAGVFLLVMSLMIALPAPSPAQGDASVNETVLQEMTVVDSPIVEGNVVDRYATQQTVVGKDQIHDLNAPDLTSALRRTPGVNISRYNNVGSFGGAEGGAVFIRGLGSSRPGAEIVPMIDGTPAYVGLWNHPLMDMLSVDPYESITVFKSSQPIHFPNAFAGLDLAPKRMFEEGFRTRLSGQYGAFNTWQETAEHGGKHEMFDYYLGQSYRRSDGHRDLSEGELTSYYTQLGLKPWENWDIKGFVTHSDSWSNDPGPEGQPELREGQYRTRNTHVVGTIAHSYDMVEGHLKFYYDDGQGLWYNQSGRNNDTKTDWDLYGLRAREAFHLWEGGEILLGSDLDWISGYATFTTDPSVAARFPFAITPGTLDQFDRQTWTIFSPYVGLSQLFGDKDGWHVIPSGGVRYYTHSQFHDEWAPQAGLVLGYDTLQLHANYARGVSYPGLNVAVFARNVIPSLGQTWRDLDAETVDHGEVGVSYAYEKIVKVDATWFVDSGRDRYVMTPSTGRPTGFRNYEEFHLSGLESSITINPVDNLSLFAGMTWLERNPSDLPYAPHWTWSLGGNWLFLDHFKLSADAQYVDEMVVFSQARREATFNTQEVEPFWLVNAKLAFLYQLENPGLEGEIFLAGQNLTDSEYEYRPQYPMPGINFSVGASVSF